jgi:heme-degrading monooxygenase HmoA
VSRARAAGNVQAGNVVVDHVFRDTRQFAVAAKNTAGVQMPTEPTIARIWRGRTRPEIADDYESYLKAEGIPSLEKTALGVQLFREDREHESWFTTISYWSDLDSMTAFTKGEPTKIHHLDRDPEFLIELPETIQIHRIVVDRQGLR